MREGHRARPPHRRPHARGRARGHRAPRRPVHRGRHRPGVTLRRRRAHGLQPRQLPAGMEPGFSETAAFTPPAVTFPNGCQVCEVEIDPDDRRRAHRAPHRGGRRRPHGEPDAREGPDPRRHRPGPRPGALRGARLRRRRPASSSPARSWTTRCRAPTTCPSSTWTRHEVPTQVNPLGAKGVGEAGTVGALPALLNAVERRAGAARRPPPRHAGHAGARLARDPGGEGAQGVRSRARPRGPSSPL